MSKELQEKIEAFVDVESDFSMVQMSLTIWPHIEKIIGESSILTLQNLFGPKNYKKLAYAILRNAFLIELVKLPAIETTKFRVRWYPQLEGDPRFCSFEECLEIALRLLNGLPAWLSDEKNSAALNLAFECGLLPYEVPIDYLKRVAHNGRIHEIDNVVWYCDDLVLRTLKLRKYLLDARQSPDLKFFKQVLIDKIKVKTYLTDRVLTGVNKTNREKRWETHPESVHFAERRICMAIEYALVTQIFGFEGFPKKFTYQLQQENILPPALPKALCPITGDTLSYESFKAELLNPTHGKSDFQVGHLNPLKLGDDSSQAAGHTAANISWISADGNRIQGSLSLSDVRVLIKRIADNYTLHNWWPKSS